MTKMKVIEVYHLGVKAFQNGDYPTAKSCFESLRDYHPEQVEAWIYLSQIAIATQRPTESIKNLREACSLFEDNLNLRIIYLNILISLGQIKKADQELIRLAEEYSDNKFIKQRRVDLLLYKSLPAQALEKWLKIHHSNPKEKGPLMQIMECHKRLGHKDEVFRLYEHLKKMGEFNVVDEYHLNSYKYLIEGKEITLEKSLKYVKENPNDLRFLIWHIQSLISQSFLEEAMALIEKAMLQVNSSNLQFKYLKSTCFFRMRDYENAYLINLELEKEDPKSFRPIVNIVNAQIERGEQVAALDLIDKVSHQEDCDRLIKLKSEIYISINDYKKAFHYSSKLVRLNRNIESLSNLARSFIKLGMSRSTQKVMSELDENYGDNVQTWIELSKLHLRLNDYHRSEQYLIKLQKVRALKDQNLRNYTKILWQKGEWRQAFYYNLASATLNTQFLSDSQEEQKQAFEKLKAKIISLEEGLNSEDHQKRSKCAKQMRYLIKGPYLMKHYNCQNEEIEILFKNLYEFEFKEQFQSMADLFESKEKLLTSTSILQENISGLYVRIAKANEAIGQSKSALAYLEKALWICKENNVILNYYYHLFSKTHPSIKVLGVPRTAIMILTHLAKLPRAEILAREIFKNTGRKVVVLRGNEDADDYDLIPKDYGYCLVAPCSDGYLELPQKVLLGYRYLYACSNASSIFKMDDDIVVRDFKRFNKMLERCDQQESGFVGLSYKYGNPIFHHVRYAGDLDQPEVPIHRKVEYCGGGAGYFLSRKNLGYIFEGSLLYHDCEIGATYEDVYFGEILDSYGVKPTTLPMLASGYTHDCYEALTLLDVDPK